MAAAASSVTKGFLSDSFSKLAISSDAKSKNGVIPPPSILVPPTIPSEWPGLVRAYFEAKETESSQKKVECLRRMSKILCANNVDDFIEPWCTPVHIQKLMQSVHSKNKAEQFQAFRVIVDMTTKKDDESLFDLLIAHDLISDIRALIRWNVDTNLMALGCAFLTNLTCNTKKYSHLVFPLIPYLKALLTHCRLILRTEAFFALYGCVRHLPEWQKVKEVAYLLDMGAQWLSQTDFVELKTMMIDLGDQIPSVPLMVDARLPGDPQKSLVLPPQAVAVHTAPNSMNDG